MRPSRFGQTGLPDHRPRADRLEIVPIERDVELPAGDVGAFGVIDETLETVGELDTTALNADQDEIVGTARAFDDLGGHADECPAERPVVEEESPGGHRGGKLARLIADG